MSEPAADGFFAAPPFKADDALVKLKRTLGGLRGLAERGAGFEWNAQPVVTLAIDGEGLQARLAKRPAMRAEWEARSLKSGADVRRFVDEVKRRVEHWRDRDE